MYNLGMLSYVEDAAVVNFCIYYFSAITLSKFMHFRKINGVVLGVLNTATSLAVPYFTEHFEVVVVVACLVSAFFVLLDKTFVKSVKNSLFYLFFVALYSLFTYMVGFCLSLVGLGANVLIYLGILLFAFFMLAIIIEGIISKKSEVSCEININGNLITAVVDSGNKIKFKGKGVVVLTKNFKCEVKSTGEVLRVNTINSSKDYPLYKAKKMLVMGEKYFYDVPCIIEENSDRVILPLSYQL